MERTTRRTLTQQRLCREESGDNTRETASRAEELFDIPAGGNVRRGRNLWISDYINRSIWREEPSPRMLRFCRTKKLESRKHEVTVHMGNSLLEESIEVLGLSVRSFNCLRRCGLMTIGDVVGKIEGEEDLLKIRNLGRKSAQEIMEKVERYQQLLLDQEKTVDSTQHL